MPGCYNSRGAEVTMNGTLMFKEIYSQIMALQYTGGKRGYVVYEENPERDPHAQNWSDCLITGFGLYQ